MGKGPGELDRRRWERYWSEREEIDDVYSNEERITRELLPLVKDGRKWVLEVGAGVSAIAPGDRVACMGGGYALHTNYAVVLVSEGAWRPRLGR